MPSSRRLTPLALGLLFLGVACAPADSGEPAAPAAAPAPADAEPGLVEMSVQDFAFVGPPEVKSGWTKFRLTNNGEQPHFMLLNKLPEGVTFEDYAAFGRDFQEQFDGYFTGKSTVDEMIGGIVDALPAWFPQLAGMGGVALISPGETGETWVDLEPGNYVMECYVVTPEGKFHGSLGMLRPLIVTDEATGAQPPAPDVRITLSNYTMQVEGELGAGHHVIEVHATENAEGFVGHDVNLARLDADTSLDTVAKWMSWIDELRIPAPAEFLGGADFLSAGRTSTFEVTLEPGRYAFVSECCATQGMIQEFTVQ